MAESGEGKKNSTKYGGGNSQTQDDGTSRHVPDRSHMSDDFTEKTNKMPKQNTSSDTTAGTRVNSQKPPGIYVSQAMGMFGQNKESQESREERLHGKNTSTKVETKPDPSSGQTRPEKFDNKKGEDRIKVTASNSAKGDGLKGFEHQTSAETSSDHSNLVMEDQDSFVVVLKEISINVQLQCGKTVTLRVDPIDSIYSVKNKLGDPEGICLMFQDKELMEEKSWLYYDIKDGDTLYAYNKQESEIEVNVKMITGDGFNVSVGLTDTVEKVMLKIEKKTGFSCEKQRLIMAGKQLLKSETLLSHGIVKDSTIHLIVKTENAPDEAEGDSSSGLASNPTVVPETSDNPESKEKRDAMENNSAEETDPNCSSQQDSTENGNVGSQIEKSDSRIQNSPSPTPTSDVGSKYLQEQEGSGMLTHPTDINSQMKVNVKKSQDFQDSKSPKSRKKVDKLTTKVSDDGSDMNQGKGDTDKESEKNIPQTPETPDTEVVEEDAKDGMNVLKIDKGLQVFVVSLDKKKIAIDVKPEETVSAVKERLMDKIDCETDDFYLYLDGEKLNEKDTLESYNIHPNSEIIMRKQRRKAQSGQGKKEEKHSLPSTDEHGTGADQAVESDEDVQPHYNNNLEESTGNPLEFTEGLVSIKGCNEGSSLKLTCSVNKQDMNAIWYKDEKPLEQNERITQISKDLTHILKIQNLCLSDAGKYTVRIENLESASKVTVKENPLAFQEELIVEDSLNEGLNLNLRCSVNKLHLKPTWYKDGKPLEKDKRITQTSEGLSHTLEIQNVCLQDSGVYTVKIENLCSTSKVTILEKPLAVTLPLQKTKKVEEGKDVQMKCIVSKPNLDAKWTFNGKVIKNMGTRILVESSEMRHQLTIRNVTMDDAGEYCLEIDDLQEKTILEVCVIDNKENEDIEGARGNSLPIFYTSGTPDENEPGDFVSLKSIHTSHANESIGKTGHSLTQKGTHRSSKTVSSGNEVENFDDSRGICQKSRLAAVPSSEDMLTPQKGHVLHNAPGQTIDPFSSKMVKEKPMVNPCGKDLEDSSQSDGKSNPHSSTEDPVNELAASLNSLNISDSDAGTARSLPPTGGQQSAGQHGASGKEDSKKFPVKYRYSGDRQKRAKLLPFINCMKYRYLMEHEAHFKKMADDLQNKKQIAVSVRDGYLHIDQGQGRMDCFETVLEFILRGTRNIEVIGRPISGVNYKIVEKELSCSESNLLKEISILVFEDMIHVACDISLLTEVDNYVSNMLKRFSYASKGNISGKSEVPYILRKILEKGDWKMQFKDKYPNVLVEWEADDDEDKVKIYFTGNENKVSEAMEFFDKNILKEYGCVSYDMIKFSELDLFSHPQDVFLEYLRVKYENQTDIVYDINEKKKRVWLCSKSSQGKADAAMIALAKKRDIINTVKIPFDKMLHQVTEVHKFIHDLNDAKYAVINVEGNEIVVKGIEKYVQELKGTIEAMLKSKHEQNMSETDCFLECDPRFLNLIKEKGVLKDLSDKKQIQYRLVEKGIYYRGEVSNFSKFDDELKKMKKEYTTHYVDIHVSKEMDRTKVSEILHKTKENYDGHIKIDENKDTTPGNYQTATVLGPILKDDLQDCLYTRWCLKTCTVTLAEKLSDLSSADLVFVPVDENSKSDFSQSVKKIAVPIPKYKKMEGKTLIDQMEKYFDSKLSDEACISVCIKSSPINEWSRCKYVKPILYSLKQWAEKSKGPRKDIVLCCWDKDAFDCCFKYCHDAFKTKCETVKPINKDLYRDDFAVKVRKGGIVDFAVDVIVNTTRDDLKLNSGAVSSTILKSAGPELQNVVNKKRPNGINYGEILETEAFKLENAEVILHGALEEYNNDAKKLQKLEEFVHSCLVHADSRQYSSIALPAIGTGKLGYNESQVAATMFKAAKKFFRDHHPSALRCVMFIIYGKDIECLKAFEKEEKLWNQYLVWQSRAVVYEGVRVQPNQGSILDTTTDAVIYFWDDGKIHGSITTRSNAVLAACGRDVFDKVSKKMRLKEANMMTLKAENIKVDMFLTRCQNSSDEISKATRECLLKADKCKDITSICIAFDKSHTFLLKKELTYNLCEAIKDVSHELHQINQVEIMVENEKSFQEVLEYFDMEKAGLLKMKEPLRIEVSGFKEHVTKAVAEIKEKFSQLQTGNDITEAEHENDKKDTEIKGTTLDKEYIEPSPIFAKYVEVHHIPKGLDIEGLRKDLFREGEFPVPLPKLVYYVGSSKALLICQSEQDAKKLSECTKQEPYKFSSVKGKAVSLLTITIDQNTVEKMKEVDKYDEFKQELVRAEIQIAGESPFKFVAPSTFQCSYAMSILKELTGTPSAPHVPGSIQDNETVTSEHDGFHNIETIKDVQENVWDILCSYEFIKIKGKDISYGEKSITVVIGQVVSKDDFLKITAIVDDLRGKEWDEIPLEAQHCNKSTVDRWCDEVKEVTGYKCCKYIAGKGKILVYAVNYDDILKIKHLIGVKTGKIKTTGKARRGGKATSDNDRRQVDTAGSFGAESKSPYRRINGKNFQKYITKENIHVFVYEANILELDVDCIVNAANESLQHGGGVAAVIERAAGNNLTKESRTYVRVNGNLPVGKACTTTAGNLSYDCVIHTVGPRWSAYSPHLLQDVQECQRHLYQAVYNSFLEAEKIGLKSIALPAISSAIFGVPEEICVQQYAKATFDYSRKTSDEPTALKEIHFIDKNSNIVKKIQDAFYLVFVKGEMPDCDTSKFVKSRRHGKGHSPGSYTGAQASFSSSVHKDSFNAQTQFATNDVYEVTQTEPLSFFDEESSAYAYLLHGKEEYKLLLTRGDLLKVKASAVVIPVDDRGNRGNIAGSLFSRIPDVYRKDYTFKLSSECHRKKECDVFITQGYECDYPFIVHAIYPANAKNKHISQRKHDVQKLYKNVFSLCDTMTGIREVVAPLLGPDIRSDTDIRACAEIFLQSYLDYYSRPVRKKSLLVNLVCREDLVYDCVKSVFDEYVMSKKAELNKTQEDMDISPSTPPVEKQDNVHGGENCVICMDTITEPETLKCGHTFCKDCIQQQFQFKQACPTCGQVCGVITGDQPPGEMRSAVDRYTDCSGYNGHGRIAITYNFPSGRQGPEHPSPGTFYKGITRVAYLPNNDEGRKILAMLEVAFKRKLVFTIGNSRTTGQEGVITWNDIHHKTNPRPHQQFGYPDPGYLERVKDELAVKGVTEKDIPKTISR